MYKLWTTVALFCTFSATAQLTIDNTVDAATGVQNYLLGTGVTVSNLTFSGQNSQFASFTCNNCGLGINSGFVMATGNCNGAIGPNNAPDFSDNPQDTDGATDPDLEIIANDFINNAAIVEFDFVALGPTVSFNFVFGSDEYLEYVGQVNDVFGFFLSGPGITGTFTNNAENIALVPNTTTGIGINTVNDVDNSEYYVNNDNGDYALQADGFTTVLTAGASGLTCGETYHIKLAIGDAYDGILDSWVFFDGGSFNSAPVSSSVATPSTGPATDSMYEGCDPSVLTVVRPTSIGAQSFSLTYSGTATNGVDYLNAPTSVDFANGQTTATVSFTAVDDQVGETIETLVMTLSGQICGANYTQTYTVYIHDAPTLTVVAPNVTVPCGAANAVLNVSYSGGIAPTSFAWEDGVTNPNRTVPAVNGATYNFYIRNACQDTTFAGSVTVNIGNGPALSVNAGNDVSGVCTTPYTLSATPTGGYGPINYTWTNAAGTTLGTGNTLSGTMSGNEVVTVTAIDQCGTVATDVVNIVQAPYPFSVSAGTDHTVNCLDVTTLNATNSGGVGTITYQWTESGNVLGTASTLQYSTSASSTITVQATDGCGQVATDQVLFTVPPTTILFSLPSTLNVECGNTGTLSPTVSGGVGTLTYTWTIDGTDAGSATSITVPSNDGTVVNLTVSDQCNNITQHSTVVNVPEHPINIVNPGLIQTDCLTPVTITPQLSGGVAPLAYTWSVGGVSQSTAIAYTDLFASNTAITLNVSDNCGNAASMIYNVSLPPVAVTANAGADANITCLEAAALSGTGSGGIGELSYQWLLNGDVISSLTAFEYNIDQDTTFTLVVQDACGNQGTDEVRVRIPPLSIEILTRDTSVCLNSTASLVAAASGGAGELQFYWDNSTASGDTLALTVSTYSTHTLTAIDECGNSATELIQVVALTVEPSFTWDYLDDMTASFDNFTEGAVSYVWLWGDGGSTTETHPTHTFTNDALMTATLVAYDAQGCVGTLTKPLTPPGALFVPTSFTPDNDGVNDLFKADGHDLKRFEMSVFNRWGERLFHSTDINEGWNGSRNDGEYYSQDGVFIWICTAEDARGNTYEKKGTVTLLR